MVQNPREKWDFVRRQTAALAAAVLLMGLSGCGGAVDAADVSAAREENSYTVRDDHMTTELAAAVVAECGDHSLTNVELNYFFWQEYYSVLYAFSDYVLSLAEDEEQPLYDEATTFQEIFLDGALSKFCQTVALVEAGTDAGFEIELPTRETLEEQLQQVAAGYDYVSAGAYLQAYYGSCASLDTYYDYYCDYAYAEAYKTHLRNAQQASAAEVKAYYEDEAERYAAREILRDEQMAVCVRAILLPAADGVESAEMVYDQWQENGADEAAFAALAQLYSQDAGSAADGGLYENIYRGQLYEELEDWCFDPARTPGDCEMVSSAGGIYLLYYVGEGDLPNWYARAQADLLEEKYRTAIEEISEACTVSSDKDLVVITAPAVVYDGWM